MLIRWTQLAYLEKAPRQFIDAVFGSSELFLYDVDKIITKTESDPSQFSWVTKQTCQNDLGKMSNEQFIDFCLLLGSPYLRTFPLFENSYPGKGLNFRDALQMFNTAGRNSTSLCNQFEEDRRVHDLEYLDRYRRALMTVKHHVILDIDGRVSLLDSENATSDMHELIGQRLPEELYFYMSKGILGAHIPSCLTSGEVLLSLPLGAEDSEIYRRLVGELLTPIRTQSICLLSNSLHRFYQTKQIAIRTWYEPKSDRTIKLKDLPPVKDDVVTWKVKTDSLPIEVRKLDVLIPSPFYNVVLCADFDGYRTGLVLSPLPLRPLRIPNLFRNHSQPKAHRHCLQKRRSSRMYFGGSYS